MLILQGNGIQISMRFGLNETPDLLQITWTFSWQRLKLVRIPNTRRLPRKVGGRCDFQTRLVYQEKSVGCAISKHASSNVPRKFGGKCYSQTCVVYLTTKKSRWEVRFPNIHRLPRKFGGRYDFQTCVIYLTTKKSRWEMRFPNTRRLPRKPVGGRSNF